MGLAGVEHGIGEILQGNTAPKGIMFPSWPDSTFFGFVGGEPAVSIIPNMLITGGLSVAFSIVFILWALLCMRRKSGGLVLILLALIMLFVGGGIFPPILGMLIGWLGTKINTPSTWWQTHPSSSLRPSVGKMWPWVTGFCIFAWLCLFPGLNMLGYFFGVNDPSLTIVLILIAIGSFGFTVFSGFAYDTQLRSDTAHTYKMRIQNHTQSGT
jgi:hypothetical protein